MTKRFHSLTDDLHARLTRNLERHDTEVRRITALLQDAQSPHSGEPMDLLAKHARGWLLVLYSSENNLVTRLIPIVDAWIEHRFPLCSNPNLHKALLVNARAEQGGVHFSVRVEVTDITADTIDWPDRSWHTLMRGEGAENLPSSPSVLISYHQSEDSVLEDSGILAVDLDEQRTSSSTFHEIRNRLVKSGVELHSRSMFPNRF